MNTPASADPRIRTGNGIDPFATARITGHALLAGGEPYLANACHEDRCSTNVGGTVHQENGVGFTSVRGAGHAVCACGALSQHLHYGADRRWWHRYHKARIILGQPEPTDQPAAVDPARIA